MQEERDAYHSSKPDLQKTKKIFTQALEFEIYKKTIRYKNENKLAFFDKIITYEEVLCKKCESGEYQIREVFMYEGHL